MKIVYFEQFRSWGSQIGTRLGQMGARYRHQQAGETGRKAVSWIGEAYAFADVK
jgi:hypothetical protein